MIDYGSILSTPSTVYAIQAPTGSGKTIGILDFLQSVDSVVIVPTRAVANSINRFKGVATSIMVADRFLAQPLQSWTGKTVVLDEAHTVSESYEKVFYILRYCLPSRLILLSATMDWGKVACYLPREVVVVDLAPTPKYKVRDVHWFGTIQDAVRAAWEPDRKRQVAIVFMASSKMCESVADTLTNCHLADTVVCRYGGMGAEDLRKYEEAVAPQPSGRVVVVATNILETGVTIPDVNIIVDSGMVYVKTSPSDLQIMECSTSMRTQRRGRTGRTCDGAYYYLSSIALPPTIPVYVDFDCFVLELIQKQLPAEAVLPDQDDRIERLTSMGCIENGGLSPLGRFILKTRYSVPTAIMIWNSVIRTRDPCKKRAACRMFAMLVLEGIQTASRHLFRVKRGERPSPSLKVFAGSDELHTFINIFLTIFTKDIGAKQAEKTWGVHASVVSHVVGIIRKGVRLSDCCFLCSPEEDIARLPQHYYDSVRDIFMQGRFPTLAETTAMDDRRLITRPTSDDDLAVYIYRVNSLEFVQLWVRAFKAPPLPLSGIESAVAERDRWRSMMAPLKRALLEEIENDVAHRPGNVRYLETMDHFTRLAEEYRIV